MATSQQQSHPNQLRALQLNVWLDATKVKGGLELTAKTILDSKADIVSLNEVKNFWGKDFVGNLKAELEQQESKNGNLSSQWYGNFPGNPRKLSLHADTAIISRYPVLDEIVVYRTPENSIVRSLIQISTHQPPIAAYSVHLEYRAYSCYLPRGYNSHSQNFPGWTPIRKIQNTNSDNVECTPASHSLLGSCSYLLWNSISTFVGMLSGGDRFTDADDLEPVTDVEAIHADNMSSGRPHSITKIIEDVEKFRDNNEYYRNLSEVVHIPVLIMGDFNEPSALDWTDAVKHAANHNGVVYEWETSRILLENGYVDSYRQLYPNPLTHPGYTWPAAAKGNDDDQPVRTGWIRNADERDRIDFIYYKNLLVGTNTETSEGLTSDLSVQLEDVWLVGTPAMVMGNKMVNEKQPNSGLCESKIGKDYNRQNNAFTQLSSSVPFTHDKCSLPAGSMWPSDHRAVMAVFRVLTGSHQAAKR
jgi:endonuclease/exonuclease/phosphatase family metal-dependent hydrolase